MKLTSTDRKVIKDELLQMLDTVINQEILELSQAYYLLPVQDAVHGSINLNSRGTGAGGF